MHAHHDQTAITVILMQPSGHMLMQLRDNGKGKAILYPEMWCFPGGGCDPGESPVQTVVREIYEEFHLHVDPAQCKYISTYIHDHMDDHVYLCRIKENAKPQLHEGKAMAWKRLTGIKKINLAWQQNQILPAIEKYIKGM